MSTKTVRGVLLDVDGVLHVSMQPVPGAAETITWLQQNEYRPHFVTNTTTMARATLAHRLQDIGLPISASQLITAPVATAAYIRQHFPGKRCWLLTKGDTALDFEGIELVEQNAEVVVIGGAEELLSYEAMNEAFRRVMDGAPLLAMHKNLYWRTRDGLQLDSGPFVSALELAADVQATIIGKPERAFFEQALATIGSSGDETLMVGDDLLNDIGGAQSVGMRAVLVSTGKHTAASPLLTQVHPDAILPSIVDLPAWLQEEP